MTPIEVVDSAVKIGLGALLGVVSSISTIYLTQKGERNRDLRAHRIKTFDQVAECLERYFSSHRRLIAHTRWLSRNRGTLTAEELPAKQAQYREFDRIFFEAATDTELALSRLRLIGEEASVVKFIELSKAASDFRNSQTMNKTIATIAELDEFHARFRQLKEEFQTELSAAFLRT